MGIAPGMRQAVHGLRNGFACRLRLSAWRWEGSRIASGATAQSLCRHRFPCQPCRNTARSWLLHPAVPPMLLGFCYFAYLAPTLDAVDSNDPKAESGAALIVCWPCVMSKLRLGQIIGGLRLEAIGLPGSIRADGCGIQRTNLCRTSPRPHK